MDELVGDVAQDGGATRGDAAFGHEGQEPCEKVVNVDRGVEFGKFGEKFGGEVFRVMVGMLRGAGVGETEMVRTKPEVRLLSLRADNAFRWRSDTGSVWNR